MPKSKEVDISTDEVHPKYEEDGRCAPHLQFDGVSCIRLWPLVVYAKAYNAENASNPNKQIKLRPLDEMNPDKHIQKEYKKYLVKELNERLGSKCKTQRCWLQQPFIRRIKKEIREELEKYTFRPPGPDKGTEWLNTQHINDVLEQYEIKYPTFKFLGAFPRDFQHCSDKSMRITNGMLSEYVKAGRTKFGIIFNTDKYGDSGEHWNALYADFKKGIVYFFDSYGIEPNKDVHDFMKLLADYIENNFSIQTDVKKNDTNFIKTHNQQKSIDVDYNQERHQWKGSECGVYSINFILRMLRGESFDDICQSKVHDDVVNKCRKIYFSGYKI